jgi:hypothetical protein
MPPIRYGAAAQRQQANAATTDAGRGVGRLEARQGSINCEAPEHAEVSIVEGPALPARSSLRSGGESHEARAAQPEASRPLVSGLRHSRNAPRRRLPRERRQACGERVRHGHRPRPRRAEDAHRVAGSADAGDADASDPDPKRARRGADTARSNRSAAGNDDGRSACEFFAGGAAATRDCQSTSLTLP